MSFFISPAYANAAPAAPGAGLDWIFIVIMIVVFYFFLIRPQSKKAKEHRNLVSGLQKGDEVVTSGGILGKITKVTDDFVVLEIGTNNLEIKVQKHSVIASLPKGTIKDIADQ